MKLVIYRTFGKVGGGYRWRLVADNGRILANGGQGYSRRIDMERAIEQVLGGAFGPSKAFIWQRPVHYSGATFAHAEPDPRRIPVEDRT